MPCFIRKTLFFEERTPDKDSPLESIGSSLRHSLFSVELWQTLRCTFHIAPFSCSVTRKKNGFNIRDNVYLQFKSCDLLSLKGLIRHFSCSILYCNVPRFVEMKSFFRGHLTLSSRLIHLLFLWSLHSWELTNKPSVYLLPKEEFFFFRNLLLHPNRMTPNDLI